MFILSCDGCYALEKRPAKGLLAGLWQFPNVTGHLSTEQALSAVADWHLRPRDILRETEKKHIFTHIQWNMKGWYIRCANMPPLFIWADKTELDDIYALPTAFRQFAE